MKKNSFVEGTFIATFSIILVKILGVLYVIPFYKIIGESGGALYSYAYNVYNLFLNISTAGIPVAISKIISEYNTLEMYEAKERSFKLAKRIIGIIALIAFFVLFVFAKEIAVLILGDISGGNSLNDVAFVIRCVSFCLLIIPFLSVTKGYLQGHKYITPSSVSQIIEQVVRIAVILMGSYIIINVLNKSVSLGVGVAVSGAFFGGVVAYIYLLVKMKKNKDEFKVSTKPDKVSDKEIIKKILSYALPLIIVSIATDIYSLTDMTLVLKASYKLGYTGSESELISSIISTWTPKICMIINAVAIGLSTSLIPHMVSSFVKKDMTEANKKFNQAISIIIVSTLPLSVGIAYLSRPIYTLFYGYSLYGTLILRYTAFQALFASIYIVISMALQSLNMFKVVYKSTILGFLTNAILDVPLMYLMKKLGTHAFYGAIIATVLGYVLSYTISLSSLKKQLGFSFKGIIDTIKKSMLPILSMTCVLILINLFLKLNVSGSIQIFMTCLFYALVGGFVYLSISYKIGLLESVFEKEFIDKIFKKLKIRR